MVITFPCHTCRCHAAQHLLQRTQLVMSYVSQKKVLDCEECVGALRGQGNNDADYLLIYYKNRGGLIFPSRDVIAVCMERDKIFRVNHVMGTGDCHSSTMLSCSSLVLKRFIGNPIFNSIKQHMYNQDPDANHVSLLIRVICHVYLNIRFHYAAKNVTTTAQSKPIHSVYNELILFTGQ